MISKLRRSQLITTWGPGALLDLPDHAVIVGGLEAWPRSRMAEIEEPRLAAKLTAMTRGQRVRLYSPPIAPNSASRQAPPGVTVYRFPEWFVVREENPRSGAPRTPDTRPSPRARRLVHSRNVEGGRFEGRDVIPTRFVRACPRGHVSDLDWRYFVHRGESRECQRQLWLDETGTGGEIGDLTVRCECGAHRSMYESTQYKDGVLGKCRGDRPWLGAYSREECAEVSRLLIRTATNAYFPQVISTLSLPNRGTEAERAVGPHYNLLQNFTVAAQIETLRQVPDVGRDLAAFTNEEVLAALAALRGGGADDRPVKLVELDAILSVPEGYWDDVPVDPNFHARRLPPHVWRSTGSSAGLESVVQLHRLRIVSALTGFTRFEAEIPDLNGEFETDVKRAAIALEPTWFPAIENRGEGVFLQLSAQAVKEWRERPAVKQRLETLTHGYDLWLQKRERQGVHPGAAYVLLHTLSHLVMQSLAVHAGYPASSIAERIYVDDERGRYGILL